MNDNGKPIEDVITHSLMDRAVTVIRDLKTDTDPAKSEMFLHEDENGLECIAWTFEHEHDQDDTFNLLLKEQSQRKLYQSNLRVETDKYYPGVIFFYDRIYYDDSQRFV